MSQPKNSNSNKSSKRKAVAFAEDETKNGGASSRHYSGGSSTAQSIVDPPSFRLPSPSTNGDDDLNSSSSSRYELWTVRLPAELNLQDLQGIQWRHEQTLNSNNGTTSYLIQLGHATENESFRVLVPEETAGTNDKDNDDDDDDSSINDDSTRHNHHQKQRSQLVPAALPFTRHWNIAVLPPLANVAPSREEAPPPPSDLRVAYGPVPQYAHLKRRWIPPGACHENNNSAMMMMNVPVAAAKRRTKVEMESAPSIVESVAKSTSASLRIKQQQEEENGGAARAHDSSSKWAKTEQPAWKRIKLEDSNDGDESSPKLVVATKREEHDVHTHHNGDDNSKHRIKTETKEERNARKAAKKAKKEKKKEKKIKKEEESAVDS